MSTPRNTKATAEAPVAPRTNPLALWSMITGIGGIAIGWFTPLPLSIAAIILGHIGLVQVKRTGEEGRSYALAGLIMGYVGFGIAVIVVAFFSIWFFAMIFGAGMTHGYDYGFGGGMMNP